MWIVLHLAKIWQRNCFVSAVEQTLFSLLVLEMAPKNDGLPSASDQPEANKIFKRTIATEE